MGNNIYKYFQPIEEPIEKPIEKSIKKNVKYEKIYYTVSIIDNIHLKISDPIDVLNFKDAENVYCISKYYYPKYNNNCNSCGDCNNCNNKRKRYSLILYYSEFKMEPDKYISNYEILSDMYGINALSKIDKQIIKKYN